MEILLFFLAFLLIIWVCYYILKPGKSSDSASPTSVVLPQTSREGQRKHPRANFHWPVSMETSDGIVEAEVKNISFGGAFICCEKPLPVGEIFRLTMKVPDNEPVEATAKAVWSNPHISYNGPACAIKLQSDFGTFIQKITTFTLRHAQDERLSD